MKTKEINSSRILQIYPESYPTPSVGLQLLQTGILLFWISFLLFMMLGTSVLFISFTIFYPSFRIIAGMYIAWMVYDQKTAIKGRRIDWMIDLIRCNSIWQYFAGYFSAQLVKTADLDPNRKYILGYSNHGVYAFSLMTNVFHNRNFNKLFPGIHLMGCTLPANFWLPIWRDYLLGVSISSCDSSSLKYRLRHENNGSAMIIALGGAEEFRYMKEGTMDVVIKKRKGFVKIALQTGVDLVPIIGFGENEIFSLIDHPIFQPLHTVFQVLFKASAPLFMGKLFGILPARYPLVTVVGKPIRVEKVEKPSNEEIDELHAHYLKDLKKLYDDFKDLYHKDRKQEIRFVS
jgi:2-acylglycerol O-acyltransferase 2